MFRQHGFTLIEMALVVAIIGLVVGGGLFAIGPVLLQAKINQTNANMDQVEAALVLFVIRNNRLPCPADGSLPNTNADYGIEVTQTNPGTSGGFCDMAIYNGAATTTNSVIPWRSLGIDETYSVDGWGNRLSFYPANPMFGGNPPVGTLVDNPNSSTPSNCLNRNALLANPPQGTRSATVCDVTIPATNITAGTGGAYLYPTYPLNNYIAVYATTTTGCGVELTQPNSNNLNAAFNGAADTCAGVTAPVAPTGNTSGNTSNNNLMYEGQRAAYVLISHGPSGVYGWTRGGTQLAPYTGSPQPIKAYNSGIIANLAGTAGNLGFVQGSFQNTNNRSSADYFDDIVRWRSPAYIIQNCGGNACGNP